VVRRHWDGAEVKPITDRPQCHDRYRNFLNHAMSAAAILAAVLLFVGNSGDGSWRSLNHLWNTGHIIAFALWTYFAVVRWPWLSRQSFWYQFSFCLLAGAGISFGIESIQHVIGRTFSFSDIRKNMVGCCTAFIFLIPTRLKVGPLKRRSIQAAMVLVILFELAPLARSVWDDWVIHDRFPTLSDMESAFEIERWSGSATLSVDKGISRQGTASLRVDMNTQKFSGATLQFFRRDWRGFNELSFEIFNPDSEPLELTCRVDDADHAISGFDYQDRFNRRLWIHPGWNAIEIAMNDIRDSPRTRSMDLARIRSVMIFAVQLAHERTIYIDAVRLKP
jgi:hypothetical protein